MGTKAEYSSEEWNRILAAPYLTAILIITADINVAFFKELGAMSRAMMESSQVSHNDLVKAIALDYTSKETQEKIKPEIEKMQDSKDPAAIKKSLMDGIMDAVTLVDSKSEEDGRILRKWLYYLAERTAEGSKEGGFLGIGAVRVSSQEQDALVELAEAFGIDGEEEPESSAD